MGSPYECEQCGVVHDCIRCGNKRGPKRHDEPLCESCANAESDMPSIHMRMSLVFQQVGPVAKNLKNVASGYAARSIDDVMDALHPLLANAGIYVIPTQEEATYQEVTVGRNNTPMRQCTLKVRFRFYGQRGDYVEAEAYGEALDSADKATNKAASAAFKTTLLQTFVIPIVGEDADTETHERNAREPEPVDERLPDMCVTHDDTGTCCRSAIEARIANMPGDIREVLREEWNDLRLARKLRSLNTLRQSDRPVLEVLLATAETAARATEQPTPTANGTEVAVVSSMLNATVEAERPTENENPHIRAREIVETAKSAGAMVSCPDCGEPMDVDNPKCLTHPM